MEKNNFSLKNLILVIIILLITLYLIKIFDISYPLTIVNTNKSTELSIIGEGKVEVAPDIAYLNAGIIVEKKPTVEEVSKEIEKINNKIIAELKNFGINKKDIKTLNYSIYPSYSYEQNWQRKFIGYEGNSNIEIKIKNTSYISSIIEIITKNGADQINGVKFSISNPDKYREQARNLAIKNAKEQAIKTAKALGIKLGKITNIVEFNSHQPIPLVVDSVKLPISGGGGYSGETKSRIDIESGTETITSIVTLYFEKK